MTSKGPLATLLVGLATAVVLLALTLHTSTTQVVRPNDGVSPSRTAATTAPAATAPERAGPSPGPDLTRATYAGPITGRRGSIAVAVHDGQAIAYLCDGNRFEVWLKGSVSAGLLGLTGANNATLVGTLDERGATGSVLAGNQRFDFQVPVVGAPSGLYRAAATVRKARIVGGWIVLPDGTQVGVLTTDKNPAPAPPLDVATRTTTVAGTPVTAVPIDGATGSGF